MTKQTKSKPSYSGPPDENSSIQIFHSSSDEIKNTYNGQRNDSIIVICLFVDVRPMICDSHENLSVDDVMRVPRGVGMNVASVSR